MEYFMGLLCAFCAAIAFGVQYVPVKQYEIFDGVTLQWFMCGGILMVGFLSSLAFGNFGMVDKECILIIQGGALWALSNYLVLPLVKLLGIGLGFSLYHFVNLIVGYVVGRFGIFGMEPLKGSTEVCDVGCGLVLLSFALMVFVEESEGPASAPSSPALQMPPALFDIDQGYRELYRQWRIGEARGARDAPTMMETAGSVLISYSTSESTGHLHSVGGFSVANVPRKQGQSVRNCTAVAALDLAVGSGEAPEGQEQPAKGLTTPLNMSRSETAPSQLAQLGSAPDAGSDLSPVAERRGTSSSLNFSQTGRIGRKLLGVVLALLAGGLAGVQSVPATLYNQRHKGGAATDVIFPQCLGIYVCSSAIYLLYAAVAKLSGWRVPHAAIRPAYASGCIWAIGFGFMICGISALGFSVGYTLDAVGPIVVASLLSIFVFKEITKRNQLVLYSIAFTLQLVGVVLMATFGEHDG